MPTPMPRNSQKSRRNIGQLPRRRRNDRAARPVPEATARLLITGVEKARWATRVAESTVLADGLGGAEEVVDAVELVVGGVDGVAQLGDHRRRLRAELVHRAAELLEGAVDGDEAEHEDDRRHDAGDGDDDGGQLGGGHPRFLRSMRVRISCSKPWGEGS